MINLCDKKKYELVERNPRILQFLDNVELCRHGEPRNSRRYGNKLLFRLIAELLYRYSCLYIPGVENESENIQRIRQVLKFHVSEYLLKTIDYALVQDSLGNLSYILEDKSNQDFTDFDRQTIDCYFQRFDWINKCDGFIPVEIADINWGGVIPFTLQETDQLKPRVCDQDGEEIRNWSKSVDELYNFLNRSVKYNIQLLFSLKDFNEFFTIINSDSIASIGGDSLHFPVCMAIWRKEALFDFDKFAVYATGKVNSYGFLEPVKIEHKYAYLKNHFSKFILFCPEEKILSGNPRHQKSDSLYRISQTLNINEIISECRDQVAAKGYLANYYTNADNHLQDLYRTVTNYEKVNWDLIISILKNFESHINRVHYPQKYLETLILLSFCYNNYGDAYNAEYYNKQAEEFAKEFNHEDKLIDLMIDKIVIYQDSERLEEIHKTAECIEKTLNEKFIDKYDLWMSFLFTLAQAHMFGSVIGDASFSSEKAVQFATDSYFKYALKLKENDDADRLKKLAKCYNYIHLYYALFKPGSKEENDKYNDALNFLKEMNEKDRKSNRIFLYKQRALAAYRYTLDKKSPPEYFDNKLKDSVLKSIDQDDSWIASLDKKYIAAVILAQKNIDDKIIAEAKRLFDEALVIPANEQSSLLLIYLRVTVAAQAYYSFCLTGREEIANPYKEQALCLFGQFNELRKNQRLPQYTTAAMWQEFLETPWDPVKPFPGLKYYY